MEKSSVIFDSKTLKKAIQLVSKVTDCDHERQRYALSCVLLEVTPEGVNLVATNGNVMHVASLRQKDPNFMGQWLLSKEAWKAILACSTSKIQNIELRCGVQYLTHTDGSEETVKTVDVLFHGKDKISESAIECSVNARFPNWRSVEPTDTPSLEVSGDSVNFKLWCHMVGKVKPLFKWDSKNQTSVSYEMEEWNLTKPVLDITERTQRHMSFNPKNLEDFIEFLPDKSRVTVSAHNNKMYKAVSGVFTCIFKGY